MRVHDNPDGPCACGAWHKPGDLERIKAREDKMIGGMQCPRCKRWIHVEDLDNPPTPLCRECHEIQQRDETQKELLAQLKILNETMHENLDRIAHSLEIISSG